MTAIGLIGAWYAPRSWMRWSSGTVAIFTGSTAGLIYTVRVAFSLLTRSSDDTEEEDDLEIRLEVEKEFNNELEKIRSSRASNGLEKDHAEFDEIFRDLLKLEKAERKIAEWSSYISKLDPSWLGQIETFERLATLFPEDQWDPAYLCRWPSLSFRQSTAQLKSWVTQFNWSNKKAEPFNQMVPDDKWNDIDFVIDWVKLFTPQGLDSFSKYLVERPYLADVQCLRRLVGAFGEKERRPDLFNPLVDPSIWQDNKLVSSWVGCFPDEFQRFSHFAPWLYPEQHATLRFEKLNDLDVLLKLFPCLSRRPGDFNRLVGDSLRNDIGSLMVYITYFPEDQRHPVQFQELIGDDLRVMPQFWDHWFNVFPKPNIDDQTHFYDFAAVDFAAWIQKNPDPNYPPPKGDAYEIVKAVGEHYRRKRPLLFDDPSLIAVRTWGLLGKWLTDPKTVKIKPFDKESVDMAVQNKMAEWNFFWSQVIFHSIKKAAGIL